MIWRKYKGRWKEVVLKLRNWGLNNSLLSKQPTLTPDTHGEDAEMKASNDLAEPLVCISSIKKLPAETFIEICCTENYNLLVVSGTATEDELGSLWMHILLQFYDTKEDTNTITYLTTKAECEMLKLVANVVELLCLRIDTYGETADVLKALSDLRYPMKSDTAGIRAMLNNDKLKIKELEKRMLELTPKTNGNKPKDKDFYQMLMSYNEVFKTGYTMKEISTFEYALFSKRLEQYIENNQTNK